MNLAIQAITADQILGSNVHVNQVAPKPKQPKYQAKQTQPTGWTITVGPQDGLADTVVGAILQIGNGPSIHTYRTGQNCAWHEATSGRGHPGEERLKELHKMARRDASFSWSNVGTDTINLYIDEQSAPSTRVLQELLALRDGWDGEGSVAPSEETKKATNAVVGQIAAYIAEAEVEVDPTVGTPAFHWFSKDQSSVISLTVQKNGAVIVVASSMEETTFRAFFRETELDKVGRALIDAGVSRLNAGLR